MTQAKCPACGATIYLSAKKPGRKWGDAWQDFTSQQSMVAPRIVGMDATADVVERRTPAARPTMESNVLVPLSNGVIVGLIGCLTCLAGGFFVMKLSLSDALSASLLGAAVGGGLGWAFFQKTGLDLLWETKREETRRPGYVQDIGPAPEPEVVQAVRIPFKRETESGYSWSIFDLPLGVGEVAFKRWAEDVLAGTSLAIGVWEREFPGNAYRKLVGQLAKHGMAEDMGGNKGYRLTDYGYQALTEYIKT